jgi:plasmid maintenance system antidote protein VapI
MNALAQYLKSNKVTQGAFATRIGVTQPVVSRLVNGTAQPGPELARRIQEETGEVVKFFHWPRFAALAPVAKPEPNKGAA